MSNAIDKTKLLVIYHGGCDDGFGAAWAVHHGIDDTRNPSLVDFHYGDYKNPPPDVTGRNVMLVDFSYKRPVLEKMIAQANSLLVLDHHKTALEDLKFLTELPAPKNFQDWCQGSYKAAAIFDMDRSGAGITWDFMDIGERISLINYLEDRDLWKKKLPQGDEFTFALRSYPQEMKVWDRLALFTPLGDVLQEGIAIKRYYRLRVEELKAGAYFATMGGYICKIANAPYFAASEVAGELAEDKTAYFGACYFEEGPGMYKYSFRSRGEFDVSVVAKAFGGGGHKNASGVNTSELIHTRLDLE